MHQIVLTGRTESRISEDIMATARWPDWSDMDLRALEETSEPVAPVRTRRPVRSVAAHRREMMHGMLVSLTAFMTGLGAIAAADPDLNLRTYAFCAFGGFLGVLIGCSAFPPRTFQALAQEILGNMGSAVAFGTVVAPWGAARLSVAASPEFHVCTGAILGITGLAIVKAARSEFVALVVANMWPVRKADAGSEESGR